MSRAAKRIRRRKPDRPAKRRGTGYTVDKPDTRDFRFSRIRHHLKARQHIVDTPSKASTIDIMSDIRDQGDIGSCTAFSVAVGLAESLMLEYPDDREYAKLSPLFLYYVTRSLRRRQRQDSGASLRDAMKAASTFGMCSEMAWPYDPSKFTQKPPSEAYVDAQRFKIRKYYRINDLQDVKMALACRNPVVLGIMLFSSFESRNVTRTGIVPMPNQNREDFLGGHAVVAVGYDDNPGHIVIRNSWGSRWGDNGRCYIPYDFFDPAEKLAVDMWTAVT